jgi:hypothetical protein
LCFAACPIKLNVLFYCKALCKYRISLSFLLKNLSDIYFCGSLARFGKIPIPSPNLGEGKPGKIGGAEG